MQGKRQKLVKQHHCNLGASSDPDCTTWGGNRIVPGPQNLLALFPSNADD